MFEKVVVTMNTAIRAFAAIWCILFAVYPIVLSTLMGWTWQRVGVVVGFACVSFIIYKLIDIKLKS